LLVLLVIILLSHLRNNREDLDTAKVSDDIGNSAELEDCIRNAEALIQESLNKGGKKGAFDKAITQGNNLANSGDNLGARAAFKRALDIGYDNRTAQNKYDGNEVKLKGQFNKFVENGNTLFNTAKSTGNKQAYQDALNNYLQAIARFPLGAREQGNIESCQAALRN